MGIPGVIIMALTGGCNRCVHGDSVLSDDCKSITFICLADNIEINRKWWKDNGKLLCNSTEFSTLECFVPREQEVILTSLIKKTKDILVQLDK